MHFCQRNTRHKNWLLGIRRRPFLVSPDWRKFHRWESYRSADGSRLTRGLGSMVDETELGRSIPLIFGWWFVKCTGGRYPEAGSDLFCWPVSAAADTIFGTFFRFPHNRTMLWWFDSVAKSYRTSHQPLTTVQWSAYGLPWSFFGRFSPL